MVIKKQNQHPPKNTVATLKKLHFRKPLLAITGQYQRGKSTLLNCLLGGYYAMEGNGLVTTRYNAKYILGDLSEVRVITQNGKVIVSPNKHLLFQASETVNNLPADVNFEISTWSPLLQNIDILDSPGYGADSTDNKTALTALEQTDFIIYVISQKTIDNESDIPFLKSLVNARKYFTIVFNCYEDQDPEDEKTKQICQEIMSKISVANLEQNYIPLSCEKPVYPTNLLWAQCALGYLEVGTHKRKLSKILTYFDEDIPEQRFLLARSGFLPLRKMVESCVKQYFNRHTSEPLLALHRATKLWESSMIEVLEKGI